MKNAIVIMILLVSAGCSSLQHKSMPIKYDNITVSVKADRVLINPAVQDKSFLEILSARLKESTISEISNQGNLIISSSCKPRTLKVIQEITGISTNTVTDVNTGFFLFQLFRGSATSTKSDLIYISTTTSVIDCESGELLGTYPRQHSGYTPIEILQYLATDNIWFTYTHQRGKEGAYKYY